MQKLLTDYLQKGNSIPEPVIRAQNMITSYYLLGQTSKAQLSRQRPGFNPKQVNAGFVVDEVTMGQVLF